MKKRLIAVLMGLALVLGACGNEADIKINQTEAKENTEKIETANEAAALLSALDSIALDKMHASYTFEVAGLSSSEYNGGAFADGAEFSFSSTGSIEMCGDYSHDVSNIRESYYTSADEETEVPVPSTYELVEDYYNHFSKDLVTSEDGVDTYYQYSYSKTADGWEKSDWIYTEENLSTFRNLKIFTDLEMRNHIASAVVEKVDGYDIVSVSLPGTVVANMSSCLTSEYAAYMLALVSVDTYIPVVFKFKDGELSSYRVDYNGSFPAADNFGIVNHFGLEVAMEDELSLKDGIPSEVTENAVYTGYYGTGYTYDELLEAGAGTKTDSESTILSVLTGNVYEELPSRDEIVKLSNGVLSLDMDGDLIDLCGCIGIYETKETFAHYYLGDAWEENGELLQTACAVMYKAGWLEPELFTAHGVSIDKLEALLP